MLTRRFEKATFIAALLCCSLYCRAEEAGKRNREDGEAKATPEFYTVAEYGAERVAAEDLEMTLARARKEDKRVLLQVGGDWCGWCKLMTKYMETNQPVRSLLTEHYLLMKVTYESKQKNKEFLSSYPKIKGYPHLFVLSSDGKLLHSQDTEALEEGRGYSEEAFTAFLKKWAKAP